MDGGELELMEAMELDLVKLKTLEAYLLKWSN